MGTFPRATFFCPTSIPLPHLHTGLSKVENMITPADLARMLGQTPDSTDNHTQDQLLYTSQTPQNSADSKQSDDTVDNVAGTDTQSADHADETAEVSTEHSMPTPATVFGMHATVTIATSSETIEGQADGIDSEA